MYIISEYGLPEALSMRVLRRAHKPSFMDEMAEDPKRYERAALIARIAARIERRGKEWAFQSATSKWLASSVSVCEVRIRGKVVRVMAYWPPQEARPVYLFDFDGHQGKSGNIPSHLLDKAYRLAQEAEVALGKD